MDDEKIVVGRKRNNTIYVSAVIFVLVIFAICGYMFFAYKNNMMPFDEPKRSFSKNSTMVPLINKPTITPLTPQQLENQKSYASQIK